MSSLPSSPQHAHTAENAVEPAVVLERVSRVYGSFVALRNVSLTVPAGASAVLVGENGAGKSTLLKVMAGLAAPSYGSVRVLGGSAKDRRGRVAYMSHAPMLYEELTAVENLVYFAGLHGLEGDAVARAREALRDVGLDPGNGRRVAEYSQGMRQRTGLARVLLSEPELLLLDEPFSNLDAGSAQRMIERLLLWVGRGEAGRGEAGAKRTLILTTHQAELARPLAELTLTMRAGELVSRVDRDGAAGQGVGSAAVTA